MKSNIERTKRTCALDDTKIGTQTETILKTQ